MQTFCRLLAVSCLWLVFTLSSFAGVHKDPELGFQMEVPKDWKKIPIANSEQWIVAKYLGNREYESKKEDYGRHTPEMKVILFPNSVVNDSGVDIKKSEEGKYVLKIKNPYKDFKAWLKDNSSGGGFYINEEKEDKINGIKTTCIEIRYEKLTVPRRALAWIFHGPDADWVVYYEALEDFWDKLGPEFKDYIRSFKLIPRVGTIRAGSRSTGEEMEIIPDAKKLTPEERAKKRVQEFNKEVKESMSRLPEGWTQQKSKNYVALSHVDDKTTAQILDQAEAIRAWLEQNFAWVGDGKAGSAIIRICKDSDELRAFVDTSRDSWGGRGIEIVTYKDNDSGSRSPALRYINARLTGIWFHDKNQALSWGMPMWLREGLEEYLSACTVKGGKLEYRMGEWQQEWFRETVRNGKLAMPRTLLLSPWQEFYKTENASNQASSFMHFLLDGPTTAKSKDFLKNYMKQLVALIQAQEAKEEAERKAGAEGAEPKPKTEEEEEAAFKERRQQEKTRLNEVFSKTFFNWTENDWKAFEQSYQGFVK